MSETEQTIDERNLGKPDSITADETFRAIVGQLWENDNDEGEVEIVLRGTDGTESVIIFGLKIKSIDGVEVEDGEAE